MAGLAITGVIGLFVALFGLVLYLSHKALQKRIAQMSGLAASKGWRYSYADPYDLPSRWGGTPFGKGYARQAEHVISGDVHGRPMVAFDYEYKEDSTDSKGNRDTTTYHFFVCVLRMPGPLPELAVAPEGFFSRIGQVFGVHDIELESEDFNRAYRVSCDNPKFASDVLHPRMMEMLLRFDPRCQFRFWGSDVIWWSSGNGSPAEVLMSSEMLSRLVDGVPAFVWKDHSGRPS
jgi:hypothetical protein